MCGATVSDTLALSSSFCRHLKLAHEFECLVTLRDFLHREVAQALQTECFYAKTGQHAAVNHRLAQIVKVHGLHCAGEKSGHAAGTVKTVHCNVLRMAMIYGGALDSLCVEAFSLEC